jgi:hypothetical protein
MIMNDKQHILTMCRDEFNRWEELVAGMSEEQITTPQLPSNLSIKDVVAHLGAWQQISIARLQAAQLNREPEFPKWLAGLNPDLEDNLERINAGIHETYRAQPWSNVHRDWREGFLRFLTLAEAIPEKNLFEVGRYPWLEANALSAVLLGSYAHHHEEHLEPLLAWLRQHGNTKIAG